MTAVVPDKLIAGLRKQFGDTARIGKASELEQTRTFCSSGSLALDFALGNGGWPTNRVVEICGPEHVGKTTLALLTMRTFLTAEPERYGLYLDCEHKADAVWLATLLGEDLMDRIILVQPRSIEQATDIYVKIVGGTEGLPPGSISVAVLDSIGGSPTMRVIDKSAESASYGGNAIGVGNFARLAASHSNIYNTLTIGINQVREDMAGLHRTIRPGGMAWKYHITQSVVLKKGQGKLIEKLSGEDVPVGQEVKAKVIKNGCAIPGRVASYWFFNTPTATHDFGIDVLEEVVRLSLLTEVITRTGAYYNHPALDGGKIMGKDALQAVIRDDHALYATLRAEVMTRLDSVADEVAPMTDPEAPIDAATGFIHPLGGLDA